MLETFHPYMTLARTLQITMVLLLIGQEAFGQHTIAGKVIDEKSREPLAFVNIIFNHDELTGTTTDINGRFSFRSGVALTSLTCSYVGYEKFSLKLDSSRLDKPITISLRESSYALNEVVVRAGENPANRIIRKVIENKDINNPERVSSFQYTSYNKVIYDFDLSDAQPADSSHTDIDSLFRGGHLFVMESVTDRKFIYPDNNEEIITGVNVSGFKESSFAPLATDIQPFSFYKDIIPILDISYLNPISNGSLSKYDFTLEDTLYLGVDTTFIISFKPQAGKNFEGLTGVLYINTSTYAIQNVIAKPATSGFVEVSLQQQYQYVEGKQWFPEQLKFELILRQNPSMTVGVRASGVSIIDHVRLNPVLYKKDFALEAIRMDDMANDRDSIFWSEHRPIPLSEKEAITYEVLDSLGEKYKFDNILKYMEKVSMNKIPIGFIDLDISKVLLYNKYEGVRLGLGVYTNDKLIKNFAVGGFFGYGFKDKGWKYGGEAIVTINKEKELLLTVRHQNTLSETGKTLLGYFNPRQFDFRPLIASQMDHIQQSGVSLGFRALRYARFNVSFNNTRIDPQYTYAFTQADGDVISSYTNTDITVNFRYAYKEKLIRSMGQRISMGTKYPILSLTYTRGLQDVFSGQFDYHKVEARVEESIYFKNLGESRIRIDAGYINNPLPYGLLFTGDGSYIRNWSVLVKNSFQTVSPYEFLSDKYVNLHYSHNFGSLLLHIGNWKPAISVVQNIGWGSLSHPEYQQYVDFKTREKGLYESGVQLDNILRMKYLNVAYMGFGAGAYYRYGPYASANASDNLAFTFSMTFSSK